MSQTPYDLIIGLDRSDKKADLCLVNSRTGTRRTEVIDTAPEALWEWLAQLRQQHPEARVGICLGTTRRPSGQLPGSLRLDHAPSHQSDHAPEV